MVHSPSSPDSPDSDMAAVAVQVQNGAHSVANSGNPAKRYRPAPAKTFQCRGFGECRMVFSRSEHLARHIRKHTGERPFSCHCSKQFSRLDNLRQHAQTVHADKQDDNERMMRDLTSLHATMSAANKLTTGPRGGKRGPSGGGANSTSSAANTGAPITLVKQEEIGAMHQRPGTSTGYEGGDMLYYENNTGSRSASNSSFRDSSQSFREGGQSFLAPVLGSAAAAAAPGQSFRGQQFCRTSSSRPTTSSGAADPNFPRSLPPLAAVVAASLSASPEQSLRPPSSHGSNAASQQLQYNNQFQSQSVLPFSSRRPSTANRPGTAPATASFFSAKPAFADRNRLESSAGRPDLSLLHSALGRSSSSGFSDQQYQQHQLGESGEISNSPGNESSPFFFNAPPPTISSSPPAINSRKRTFGGPDGPCDDSTPLRNDRPTSSAGYDYGSESRPQSRRLSVMELCNDDEQQRPSSQRRDLSQCAPGSSAFLLYTASTRSSYDSTSRPTTSSGLVSSTSTLRLIDRPSPGSSPSSSTAQPPPVFSRTSNAATGPARTGTSSGSSASGTATSFGRIGGGLHPTAPTFTDRIPSSGSSIQVSSSGASSPSSSPSTPTYSSTTILSTSTSSSSSYPNRATLHHLQQPQQFQQQFGQSYQSSQQQQHSSQYQLTHSPTFSSASSFGNASGSPRSPSSDHSSPSSPFATYTRSAARGPGLYGDASSHAVSGVSVGRHAKRDVQVRAPVSPHATSFGMRA